MGNNRTILVFIGTYLPGNKAGGPIRSVSNLVELLGDELDFKIITADHDFSVAAPYPDIKADTWTRVGKADVYYASRKSLGLFPLFRLIKSIQFDVIYFNGFFCWDFTIKPLIYRYLNLIPDVCSIITPRGAFSQGALKLKSFKKTIFINLVRLMGLYRNLIWQASSPFERADIQRIFEDAKVKDVPPIFLANGFVRKESNDEIAYARVKKSGELKIVFLSRISPKKNLDGALSILKGLQGDISFNIYGPMEDLKYLQLCKNICDSLNANIKVIFHGEVDHGSVHGIFGIHHMFFFPTWGENFGHVILESLLSGCPVLLSDQTPWRDLESLGIGWDIPLEDTAKFRAVLEQCVDMQHDEFIKISKRSAEFGNLQLNKSMILEQNKELFCTRQ